jgi:hypothetical protein
VLLIFAALNGAALAELVFSPSLLQYYEYY